MKRTSNKDKLITRMLIITGISLLALAVLLLSACGGTPEGLASTPTPTPLSVIHLVENNDGVKDAYTKGRGDDSFEDVSLEQGMATAQVMCSVSQSITVGSASMLNAVPLTLEKCPELGTDAGVRMQLVGTQTVFGFDCRHCTLTANGTWEYGQGVRAWRGTVRITRNDAEDPSLFLVPLQQP